MWAFPSSGHIFFLSYRELGILFLKDKSISRVLGLQYLGFSM